MNTSTVVWIVVAVIIVLGGWYLLSGNSNAPSSTSAPAAQTGTQNTSGVTTQPQTTKAVTTTTTPAPSGNLVLSIQSAAGVGQYLVGANGMALYTSTDDRVNISNCMGQCATAWPPYTVSAGASLAVKAVIGGKIGTMTRPDGSTLQLTYNGMPLYFWTGDKKVGDVTGNGAGSFHVAKP